MKENVKSEEAVKIKETKSEDVKTDEAKTANTSKCECCCHKKKERSEKEYKDLIHRLNRIEGRDPGNQTYGRRGCLLPGYSGSGICGKCSVKQLQ